MSGSTDYGDMSMLELFRMEAEMHSKTLNDGLLQIEAGHADSELYESLMRAAHSIKGAARVVQLDNAVHIAHALEDCFAQAVEHSIEFQPEIIECMLRANDLFSEISQTDPNALQAWLQTNSERLQNRTKALRDLLASTEKPSAQDDAIPPEPVKEPDNITDNKANVQTELSTRPAQKTSAPKSNPSVWVSTQNLQRLMNLSGEAVVASRNLRPYSKQLLKQRRGHFALEDLLEQTKVALDSNRPIAQVRSLLIEALNRASQCRQLATENYDAFEEMARRSAILSRNMHEEVIATRMRPFSDGIGGFPRMMRDLAKELGKAVNFSIRGKDTKVDRDILQMLESPITHLLRNALDHGIEPEGRRRQAGKKPEGQIVLEASHQSGMLLIQVRDDGRGIDFDTLRLRIVDRKLADADMASQFSEAELIEFLFLPGFTTHKAVTEISGRGYGLDVVRSMVQHAGGTVTARSKPGRGTTFQMNMPLTLSVMRSMVVEIGNEQHCLPIARIDRIVKIAFDEIKIIENQQYIEIQSENIGLVSARQILDLEESDRREEELPVILFSDREHRYGLIVDNLVGERNIVVRPLEARLGKVPNISAAAILRNGLPVLILDIDDVIHSIEKLLSQGRLKQVGQAPANETSMATKRVLIVDDSLTVREVQRRLLENNGYEVDTAVDGVDGWNLFRRSSFDLVISDIDMPRMNGIELTKMIKSDPQYRRTPLMIVSYKDREEDRQQGLEAGANYYLTKSSFHDESLLQAVIDLIGAAAG